VSSSVHETVMASSVAFTLSRSPPDPTTMWYVRENEPVAYSTLLNHVKSSDEGVPTMQTIYDSRLRTPQREDVPPTQQNKKKNSEELHSFQKIHDDKLLLARHEQVRLTTTVSMDEHEPRGLPFPVLPKTPNHSTGFEVSNIFEQLEQTETPTSDDTGIMNRKTIQAKPRETGLFDGRKRSAQKSVLHLLPSRDGCGRKKPRVQHAKQSLDYLYSKNNAFGKVYIKGRENSSETQTTSCQDETTGPSQQSPVPADATGMINMLSDSSSNIDLFYTSVSCQSVVAIGCVWENGDTNVRDGKLSDRRSNKAFKAQDGGYRESFGCQSVIFSVFTENSDLDPRTISSNTMHFVIRLDDPTEPVRREKSAGQQHIVVQPCDLCKTLLHHCAMLETRIVCYNSQQCLKPILHNSNHQEGRDAHLRCISQMLAKSIFDVRVASWLLSPARQEPGAYRFDAINCLYGGHETEDRVVPDHPYQQVRQDHMLLITKLYPELARQLIAEKLWDVFWHLEMPLSLSLMRMEVTGLFSVDMGTLANKEEMIVRHIHRLEQRAYMNAGVEFNLSSPSQVANILFQRLKLKPPHSDKGGNKSHLSTDQSTLLAMKNAALASQHQPHEIIEILLRYRSALKALTAYVRPLKSMAVSIGDGSQGILKTHWNQCNTATGRISSSSPNLQGLPRETIVIDGDLAINIRNTIVCCKQALVDNATVLVRFDYSQIEMRVLAHFVGKGTLYDLFLNHPEIDVYKLGAAEVYQKPVLRVTDQERNLMKRGTLAIVYGAGPKQIAKDLRMSEQTAKDFIQKFLRYFKNVSKYINTTKQWVNEHGFVQTISGRKRYFSDVMTSQNASERSRAQRQGVNAIIQGTAADLMKGAIVKCHAYIDQYEASCARGSPAKLLATIHDEIVIEVTREKEIFNEVVTNLTHILESIGLDFGISTIPLPVKVEYGASLGEMQPFTSSRR
jgi:DNA polymerase I-like protein with 3'-5' exonuclease and polymerase domains